MMSEFDKDRRLIVVSNRLPFTRLEDGKGGFVWEKSAGGLITAMEPVLLGLNGIWIGWDGMLSEKPENESSGLIDVKDIEAKEEVARKQGRTYSIACVPIDRGEFDEYYNYLSNGTLWALFHYFFEKCFLDYNSWRTYCRVNERFARYIDNIAGENDIIWIHDFHLFMTPYYLRRLRPRQAIHFFLHIPFPHIDIFDILPWKDQILNSLLCCDTVGFHHKRYFQNFKGAVDQHCKGEKYGRTEKMCGAGGTYVYVNPISIDFDVIDRISRSPSVAARREEIRKQAICPKIIIGVDRIDYSKGIRERLLGLECLLKEHPELKEEFFYYQLVIPSREEIGTYMTLKKEIDEIIGRINGEFASGLWAPVHYNYGTVSLEELVALYSAADIALVTPLRDGMNLVCKEYIAAHSDNDGILILSKFAGAIAEIKNCLPVNPYSIEDIADTIYQALHMPEEERKKRMKKMRKNIGEKNINKWLENCMHYFDVAEQQKDKQGE
ncbi:MAG: trehalose-6-phosphate synthase [Candidatus Omnitrophota bacterium]